MKLIPLRNRAGEVVAHAKVDDADYAALSAHRWHRSGYGYAARCVWLPEQRRTRMFLMHRVILGLRHGDVREGDHINRVRLDNQRSNLRILPPGGNPQNLAGWGRSPHRGVCWHKQKRKWMAYARVNGRIRHIGYFRDEQAAADAASAFRREHMPYAVEDAA